LWNFGDGATSTSVAVPHTYAAAGNYTVTLTVRSAAGTNSFAQIITVSKTNAFPWWLVAALLVLFLVLLLLLLLLWRRRDVVVVQVRGESDNPKCHGDGKCDDCELKPC
jgi:PKD repeat protein